MIPAMPNATFLKRSEPDGVEMEFMFVSAQDRQRFRRTGRGGRQIFDHFGARLPLRGTSSLHERLAGAARIGSKKADRFPIDMAKSVGMPR
jgi:hypothetical protein